VTTCVIFFTRLVVAYSTTTTRLLLMGLPRPPRHRRQWNSRLLSTTQVQVQAHDFVQSCANALIACLSLTSNTLRLWTIYVVRPSGTMGPALVELRPKPRSATTICTTVGDATTICTTRPTCDTGACLHRCRYVHLSYLFILCKHVWKLIIYTNLGFYQTPGAGPSSSTRPGT
jgi:hypothetical protein